MYSKVAWDLVFSGTQVQPQIMLEPNYLPDYLSVSHDYVSMNVFYSMSKIFFFVKVFSLSVYFLTTMLSFSLKQVF